MEKETDIRLEKRTVTQKVTKLDSTLDSKMQKKS